MAEPFNEKVRDDEYLRGRENYYTWLRNFNDYCYLENYLVDATNDTAQTYVSSPAATKAMKKWIHKRVANGPGRQFFAIRKTIPEILATFNEEFGSGFADPDMLIDAIKNQIYFDSRRDYRLIILKGLENVSTKTNFWDTIYCEIKKAKRKENPKLRQSLENLLSPTGKTRAPQMLFFKTL